MKIGSGWTKTNKTNGGTFISISLDETILELVPQLKNCNLSLGWVKEEDKKTENSPSWTLNLTAKRQKTDTVDVKNAEEQILNSAQKTEQKEDAAEDLIPEEDIPF